ncbi:MAG TPA: cell division protein ZapA [Gammaproteobacteria bacterium]|jgi:cell division protein ZapA|nr:cell division protein ZapA [Gammaproteobacteria bacterium]
MATSIPVTVYILDKEYRVACPEDEHSALLASADLLNARMKQIRESGKVIGADRVAVMAALNLTHELLSEKSSREVFSQSITSRLRAMEERVNTALAQDNRLRSEAS